MPHRWAQTAGLGRPGLPASGESLGGPSRHPLTGKLLDQARPVPQLGDRRAPLVIRQQGNASAGSVSGGVGMFLSLAVGRLRACLEALCSDRELEPLRLRGQSLQRLLI